MTFLFDGITEDITWALDELKSEYAGFLDGVHFTIEKADGETAFTFSNGTARIQCFDKRGLFQALTRIAAAHRAGKTCVGKIDRPFKTMGVMYDCSRNSVPTVESVKLILRKLAMCGYNALMLYTEDTFEIKEYPAFGHFRGRYTPDEVKEMDDYAQRLGIELIPCIQTLAHLERFLRWPCTAGIKDTEYVLMTEDKKTFAFLESAISAISGMFSSRRIHVGMDEAHTLGLGRKLLRDGYTPKLELMKSHLQKVLHICEKHGLSPMIWGDMIFRENIAGGEYYDINVTLPENMADVIPPEVQTVYWDYYHPEKAFYDTYINEHKKLGIQPIVALGLSSWGGMVPNLEKTWMTAKAGIASCVENGITEVFVCNWKDNGGEAPPGLDIAGFLMFGEAAGIRGDENGEAVMDALRDVCPVVTGADFDLVYCAGAIDGIDRERVSMMEPPNPQKYFLWQDILLGQFDFEAGAFDVGAYYQGFSEKLSALLENGTPQEFMRLHLELTLRLSEFLALKADFGWRLWNAYQRKDLTVLGKLRDETTELLRRFDHLYRLHAQIWFTFFKPFGWEVCDIKYGGLKLRLETACKRLSAYLSGEIAGISELEEPRILCTGEIPREKTHLPHYNEYVKMASTSLI